MVEELRPSAKYENRKAPSSRRRFVARAMTLSADADFVEAVDAARRDWNRRFPKYRMTDKGGTPYEVPMTGAAWLLPPPLDRAIHAAIVLEETGAPPAGTRSVLGQAHAGKLVNEWRRTVLTVAGRFWPADDFPDTLGPDHHPAQVFIAAAIIGDARFVPPEAILRFPGLAPRRYAFPPDDGTLMAESFEMHEQVTYLTDRLSEAAAKGESIGPDEIRNLLRVAAEEGKRGRRYVPAAMRDSPGWIAIELHSDITSQDWRDAEAAVITGVRQMAGDDAGFVRRRVSCYSKDGFSDSEIARRLGIDRKTVTTYVSEMRPEHAGDAG